MVIFYLPDIYSEISYLTFQHVHSLDWTVWQTCEYFDLMRSILVFLGSSSFDYPTSWEILLTCVRTLSEKLNRGEKALIPTQSCPRVCRQARFYGPKNVFLVEVFFLTDAVGQWRMFVLQWNLYKWNFKSYFTNCCWTRLQARDASFFLNIYHIMIFTKW